MKKVLFLNTVCGYASTGKLIGELVKLDDYESLVCYGRKHDYLGVNSYRFTNFFDNAFAAMQTIIFGNSINICRLATKRLIKKIKEYNPDVINIHNLHGYYLNIPMLFEFLKEYGKPVTISLHDCWTITGYCPHFDGIGCDKYQTKCEKCEYPFSYPFSIFKQRVTKEYEEKKRLFSSMTNLTVITTSKWLDSVIRKSILKNNNIVLLLDGINLDAYKKTKPKNDRFTVLAVASAWTKEKGIDELNKIIPLLDKDIDVVVIGQNSDKVIGCKAIARTTNKEELIDLYSSSHVLINPTLQETFGLVNVEANACGTPVITYRTGGSPETINEDSGIVVDKYDYKKMAETINSLKDNYYFDEKEIIENSKRFNKKDMINNYGILFNKLIKEYNERNNI